MTQKKGRAGMLRAEARLAWLLVSPALFVIALIAFYPVFRAFLISLQRVQLQFIKFGQPFVGLGNYAQVLTDDRFWNALGNTGLFTFVTVLFEFLLGLLLAVLMNIPLKGRGVLRASVLIPWALTTVVSAIMWQFMYNDQYGILNALLLRLHLIAEPVIWLGKPSLALISAMIADIWKTTPFMALLLLAGLQVIPADIYEAARIDGTTPLQAFLRITLPLLKPAILVALLFRALDAFRVFDLIFVLTGGGPGNSTETLSLLTYIKLFREFDFGVGSALAVITFICVVIISYVFIKVLGARAGEV